MTVTWTPRAWRTDDDGDDLDPADVERMVTELVRRVKLDLPPIPRDEAWEELCAEVGSRKMDRVIWPEAYHTRS